MRRGKRWSSCRVELQITEERTNFLGGWEMGHLYLHVILVRKKILLTVVYIFADVFRISFTFCCSHCRNNWTFSLLSAAQWLK